MSTNPYNKEYYPDPQYVPNNTLAIVGLVLGVFNFVFCPVVAPFGLICSVMSMRNPSQRGLSIAGIVVNCIGLVALLMVLAYVFFMFAMVATAAGVVTAMAPVVETETAFREAREVISREDPIPTADDGQLILELEDLRDGWDKLLRYEPDGDTFIIRSAGADGEFFTPDDMTSDGTSRFDEMEYTEDPEEMGYAEEMKDAEEMKEYGSAPVDDKDPATDTTPADSGDFIDPFIDPEAAGGTDPSP